MMINKCNDNLRRYDETREDFYGFTVNNKEKKSHSNGVRLKSLIVLKLYFTFVSAVHDVATSDFHAFLLSIAMLIFSYQFTLVLKSANRECPITYTHPYTYIFEIAMFIDLCETC